LNFVLIPNSALFGAISLKKLAVSSGNDDSCWQIKFQQGLSLGRMVSIMKLVGTFVDDRCEQEGFEPLSGEEFTGERGFWDF
jgi:hypothetical protein